MRISRVLTKQRRRWLGIGAAFALAGASTRADVACCADFNRDGYVTEHDLAAFLASAASPSKDLTGDGVADSSDLAALLAMMGSICVPYDVNGDAVIDGADLAAFASAWLNRACHVDFNADAVVDGADYALLRDVATPRSDAPAFTPDRRPIVVHRVWNGSYATDNPAGLAEPYRADDAPLRMAQTLQQLHDEGWRRIWLILPAGCRKIDALDGTIEEWRYRSDAWRRSMRNDLADWIAAHPDTVVGVYMGLRLRNGVAPTSSQLKSNLDFWTSVGFREFAFDASAPSSAHTLFLSARTILAPSGARAILEAYPTSAAAVDRAWLRQAPMMALSRFVDAQDPQSRWAFDAERTEVIIELGRSRHIELHEMVRRLAQGYVPVVYSTHADNRLRALSIWRWFDAATAQ